MITQILFNVVEFIQIFTNILYNVLKKIKLYRQKLLTYITVCKKKITNVARNLYN